VSASDFHVAVCAFGDDVAYESLRRGECYGKRFQLVRDGWWGPIVVPQ
jgi:hypothetical protein